MTYITYYIHYFNKCVNNRYIPSYRYTDYKLSVQWYNITKLNFVLSEIYFIATVDISTFQ